MPVDYIVGVFIGFCIGFTAALLIVIKGNNKGKHNNKKKKGGMSYE